MTLARILSDTFSGIAPASVLPFVAAQAVGAVIACAIVRLLWPTVTEVAEDVLVPHDT